MQRDTSSCSIVLEIDRSPEEALGWYRTALEAAGWTRVCTDPEDPAGFLASTSAVYAHRDGFRVRVLAFPGKRMWTGMRVDLARAHPGSVGSGPDCPGPLPARQRLPALVAPDGARQFGQGANVPVTEDRIRAWSRALVLTELNVSVLRDHFDRQLQEAGWTLLRVGENGPVAGSTWTFRDGDERTWRGHLYLLRISEGPKQYQVTLHAETAAGDRREEGNTDE